MKLGFIASKFETINNDSFECFSINFCRNSLSYSTSKTTSYCTKFYKISNTSVGFNSYNPISNCYKFGFSSINFLGKLFATLFANNKISIVSPLVNTSWLETSWSNPLYSIYWVKRPSFKKLVAKEKIVAVKNILLSLVKSVSIEKLNLLGNNSTVSIQMQQRHLKEASFNKIRFDGSKPIGASSIRTKVSANSLNDFVWVEDTKLRFWTT